MANRRMFSKEIVDSDAFLDMPLSTQALYFHLAMRADDDGFVNNPKKLSRMIGASDDEFKVLLAKNFLLSFESGIIVIKHWRLHNYIQKDRYKTTTYIEEKGLLGIKENGVYTLYTDCVQNVDSGKVRIELGKDRLEKEKVFSFSLKIESTYEKLSLEYKGRLKEEIEKLNLGLSFIDFVDSLIAKGYKYKNFLMAYKTWCKKDFNSSNKLNSNNAYGGWN